MSKRYRSSDKNEMDSQRELLDSLMGINRNNDREEEQVTDFRDDRCCKFYITGLCPNDVFVNTKMDTGPCSKVHSDELKAQYEKSSADQYRYDSTLEREFLHRINEAEKIIRRARQRVEDDKIDENLDPDVNPDIIRINQEMSSLLAAAQTAGDEGDIEKVYDLVLNKVDALQKERAYHMRKIEEMKRQAQYRDKQDQSKKLRVCDVCGSFLSIFDSDQRLSDHFMGKQHTGFQYMRDAVEAIRARREARGGGAAAPSYSSYNGSSSSGNGGGRERSRDRDHYGGGGSYRSGLGYNADNTDSRRDNDNRYGRGRDRSRDRGNRDRDSRDNYRERDRERDRGYSGNTGGGRNDRNSRDRNRDSRNGGDREGGFRGDRGSHR